jgi:hypothetical protein
LEELAHDGLSLQAGMSAYVFPAQCRWMSILYFGFAGAVQDDRLRLMTWMDILATNVPSILAVLYFPSP